MSWGKTRLSHVENENASLRNPVDFKTIAGDVQLTWRGKEE